MRFQGWIILVRADGTIFPDAVAMMSTLRSPPSERDDKERHNSRTYGGPTGEAGVFEDFQRGGKNCNAMGSRFWWRQLQGTTLKVSLSAGLQLMQGA